MSCGQYKRYSEKQYYIVITSVVTYFKMRVGQLVLNIPLVLIFFQVACVCRIINTKVYSLQTFLPATNLLGDSSCPFTDKIISDMKNIIIGEAISVNVTQPDSVYKVNEVVCIVYYTKPKTKLLRLINFITDFRRLITSIVQKPCWLNGRYFARLSIRRT